MAKPYCAGASEAHVAQAARHALERGGNAVDAVAAGLFAAAAESPGVFLGPLQLLAAGGGAGLIAIDGRTRQPGLGVPRPRGVVAGAEVPDTARVGVPGLPFALSAAHGSLGNVSMLTIWAPAAARARELSPERAALLEFFARRGTAALLDESVAAEIVAAAGRAAGGSLTRDDLAAVRPAMVAQVERELPGGILTVPWPSSGPCDAASTQVLAAADSGGLFVAASYEAPLEGLPVPSLGLVAPLTASPVMRGEPRLRPGDTRPAAAPLAWRLRRGIADLALGLAAATDAEALLSAVLRSLDDASTLVEALATAPTGRMVALSRPKDVPVVVRSA